MLSWAIDLFAPKRGVGRERFREVCVTLDAQDRAVLPVMGTSNGLMQKPLLSSRIDLLISLSVYVLPRLSIQTTTAIERNVAVKFGESLAIQRAIMRETTARRSLSAIVKGFDRHAQNSHDEGLRLFTHLCDIIGQSAQGGMTVRGRLNAVASRLGVPRETASNVIARLSI